MQCLSSRLLLLRVTSRVWVRGPWRLRHRYLPRYPLSLRALRTYRLLLAGLLLATGAYVQGAESLPRIQIYTEVRNAANIAANRQGQSYVDNPGTGLILALLEEAGLEYDIHLVPWARIMQTLQTQPNTLAYSLSRTAQREALFHWIGLIRPVDVYLFGLADRLPDLPDTLEQARDYRIGTIRGDFADEYFSRLRFPNLVYIGNKTPWLTMMERDRIDLVPFGVHGIKEFLEQRDQPADRLVPVVRLDALSTGLYIALSKSSDPEIQTRLKDAYQMIVADGRYESLMGFPHPAP